MKLSFIPLKENHAKDLLPIWQDLDVIKYTYIKNITDIESAKQKIRHYLNYNYGTIGPFVVKVNDKVIGLAAGMSPKGKSKTSEIFFHFEKSSWRKGYGTQTVYFLLKHGFVKNQLEEIQAQAIVDNIGSWGLLEKVGFINKSLKKKSFKNEIDVYSYSISISDYHK
ncbi:MAG: GNAT family N-acetyltransferase [Spirochaetaceae bacterium]